MKKILVVFAGVTLTFAAQARAQSTTDAASAVKLGAKTPVATPLPSKSANNGNAAASAKQASATSPAVAARKAATMTLQLDTTQTNASAVKAAPRASGKMRTAAPPIAAKTSTARAKN